MKKETILWIGKGMPCSIKDGMSWHFEIPGYNLYELLANKYNLCKGHSEDWALDSGKLYFNGDELTQNFLSDEVLGAIFHYRYLTGKELKKLQEIFLYLQENFPHIRLLNSPVQSKLCLSKIEFSKHVSELPSAKHLLPAWRTLETEDDLDSAIKSIKFPFLIKPDTLASGEGIIKIEDRATALKVLEDSYKGKYFKSNWTKIKHFVKRIVVHRKLSEPQKEPIKLLATDFVDTYSDEYKCYINATIYYWMGELCYADARVSHTGYNIHAGDSTNNKLTIGQYEEIITKVMGLIKRESNKINEMVNSFNRLLIRVDCLINLDEDQLKVAEIAIKGGPGITSRENVITLMEEAGWNEYRIREYLGGKSCEIENLFQ